MSRRAARIDDNQEEIAEALRLHGFWVYSTAALGGGFPDLLVCRFRRFALLEVKDGRKIPSKRRLTPAERGFFAACPGPVFAVESVEQAIRVATEATR